MQVRRATPDDARGIEQVRLDGWRTAYRGMIPDTYLDELQVRPERLALLAERLTSDDPVSWLAEEDGVVLGMAVAGSSREDDAPDACELYALYVAPSAWRHGLGTALLQACDDVRRTELVWVLEANWRARAFYERHGFRPDGTSKLAEVGGAPVEVRYRRS